jgi:hypothetical protein
MALHEDPLLGGGGEVEGEEEGGLGRAHMTVKCECARVGLFPLFTKRFKSEKKKADLY